MQTMQQPGGREQYPARLLAAWEWLRDWARRHPAFVDVVPVVVLLWLAGVQVWPLHGARQLWSLALALAVVVPLAWRRRAPFAVFAIIVVAAAVQLAVSTQISDDAALLAAFYTIAAYDTSRRILLAGGILIAGAVPAALLPAHSGLHDVLIWAFLSSLVVVSGLTGWYVRSRRERLEQLGEQARRLERERDQQALLAAAAERQRIAREMHDIVAHNIAVMIALADGAAYAVTDSPQRAAAVMGEVSAAGRSALTEMRRLLGVLRQPAAGPEPSGDVTARDEVARHVPQPTLADLSSLLAAVRTAGLPVTLTVTGQPSALPPSAQLTIYRMIQEALTNTLKHAPGASARVSLCCRPGEVELEVTDTGHGAVPGGAPGHGIAGMRERAAVFGGEVSAGPGPGGGWRVQTVLRLGPVPDGDAVPDSGPVPDVDPVAT